MNKDQIIQRIQHLTNQQQELVQQLSLLDNQQKQLFANANAFNGAIEECRYWLSLCEANLAPESTSEDISVQENGDIN